MRMKRGRGVRDTCFGCEVEDLLIRKEDGNQDGRNVLGTGKNW